MTEKKKKATGMVAVVCALIFLAGIGGSIWNLTRSHGRRVEILQDGEILDTLDLDQAEDQIFTVTYEGRTNEIEIRDHRIRVKAADCPDQICVRMDCAKLCAHRMSAQSSEHPVRGYGGSFRAGRGGKLTAKG